MDKFDTKIVQAKRLNNIRTRK